MKLRSSRERAGRQITREDNKVVAALTTRGRSRSRIEILVGVCLMYMILHVLQDVADKSPALVYNPVTDSYPPAVGNFFLYFASAIWESSAPSNELDAEQYRNNYFFVFHQMAQKTETSPFVTEKALRRYPEWISNIRPHLNSRITDFLTWLECRAKDYINTT